LASGHPTEGYKMPYQILNIYSAYLVALLVACSISWLVTPWLIQKLRNANRCGYDMNKRERPMIPEMGGIAVVIGFIAGVYTLLYLQSLTLSVGVMTALFTVIGVAFIGLLDDLVNLRKSIKGILPFFIALPLGLYATNSIIMFPGIGPIDFGIYIILIVPLGVTCAANATNMLEGFNGLSAGLGIIITMVLIIISIIKNLTGALFLLFPLLGALIAFLWFNIYPAKIFPGDTLTMFTGATIATAAILGNLKFVGAILLLPMILEFFLKLRGRFQGQTFGTIDHEGYLYYNSKIESLAHLFMSWRKLKEWQLVSIFWLIEILIGAGCIFYVYYML
jgi:UDP-N-acetylglucosamine--dolichyl-phosphate N-acetylglucosaminephosphotransferase